MCAEAILIFSALADAQAPSILLNSGEEELISYADREIPL
jgi:hypothetical protein